MGQKTHPRGIRLGVTEKWNSKWFHDRHYAQFLHEDIVIRKFIKNKISHAGVAKVVIERVSGDCTATIHTSRPGIVIGRRGAESDKLQAQLKKLTGRKIKVKVAEVKRAELDAQLVSEAVAMQIERRANFRYAIKKNIESTMSSGAEGVKIAVSGRLGGHEMARSETASEGRVPLHTLRADIDYGFSEADTTYGKIGVKVWIFKGEILSKLPLDEKSQSRPAKSSHGSGSGHKKNKTHRTRPQGNPNRNKSGRRSRGTSGGNKSGR